MTTIQFADGSAVTDAIADVRNDATETNWTLAKHKDNEPGWVIQSGSGSGGVAELVENLDKDAVQYGLLRISQKIDLSTTVKFVYIYYVGENVPFVKQGRIGIVHGDAKRYFSPFHIDIEVENPAALTEESVNTKLAQNSGKHDNINDAGTTKASGVQERGFTNTSSHVTSTTPKKTSAYGSGFQGSTNKASATVAVQVDSALVDAVKDVRDDKTETTWVLGKYEDDDVKKNIILAGKGSGSLDEMLELVSTESIAYGFTRVTDVIESIKTVKFVFINFIGHDVGIMKKAKISTHKGAIQSAFGNYHVDFDVSYPKEISDDIVKEKVALTSGSKSKIR